MKVRCEYCGNYIDETEEVCHGCNAVNKNYKRQAVGVPTTIDELKRWYIEHNLPPEETTRFFIGIDYKEPKAFGIYKDESSGHFIVYKNKDTGERAIRYDGKDEKYAVNELYLKLKEEILHQKSNNGTSRKKKDHTSDIISVGFLILFFSIIGIISILSPDRGYYNINDNEYYYVHGKWFIYENSDWRSTSKPSYDGPLHDYYDGNSYYSNDNYSNIENSSVYDSSWDSSDWDSDSSWDSSDSWDSGGSDWSSDW